MHSEPTSSPNVGTCPGCGKGVPLDEAVVPEAVAYVAYFCGLECYARWRTASLLALGLPPAGA